MVHDLRLINKVVIPTNYDTPNPYTMLNAIASEHQFFTCIDLANAFFCVPIHKDSQSYFTFTYGGQQYTYSRLPQGFIDSPSVFNYVLAQKLKSPLEPQGTMMLQYVDDILLAAPDADTIMEVTEMVLRHLAKCEFRISKSKLQVSQPKVTFLGRVIWSSSQHISEAHHKDILSHSKPEIVRAMMQFLGLVTYSKNFIPNFSGLVAPLCALITQAGYKNYSGPLQWTPKAEQAFVAVKITLSSAPNYSEPFHLDVDEKNGFVNAVLFQKGENRSTTDRRVLMYYSSKLDNIEVGHSTCVRHGAAIGKAVQKTSHITMSNHTIVHPTHGVKAFLDSNAFTMSSHRLQGLQQLLNKPHIHFTSAGTTMASQMDTEQNRDCAAETNREMKLHDSLQKEPRENAQLHNPTGTLIVGHLLRGSRGEPR